MVYCKSRRAWWQSFVIAHLINLWTFSAVAQLASALLASALLVPSAVLVEGWSGEGLGSF